MEGRTWWLLSFRKEGLVTFLFMPKLFQKKVEDFVCEKCGTAVKGSGYTNHCPHCLWSKHVDVNPGDRAAVCCGMMEPVNIVCEKGDWVMTHRCLICGHEKRNKVEKNDNQAELQKLALLIAERFR
jgi:hypothetical protein